VSHLDRGSPRRLALVTGGSAGIGLAAAVALAGLGFDLVLLGRHPGRLARAVERVREVSGRTPASYRVDFEVLDEVRAVASRIASEVDRIDVLANNAGGLGPLTTRSTVDGFDPVMQVNYLAGFVLCQLLLERMRAAYASSGTPARLITTGSLAEVWGWLDVDRPVDRLGRYRSRWLAYGASKRANLLFTREAARRWVPLGVVPTCFFPGLVRSRFALTSQMFSLGRLLPIVMSSPRRGADTLVWLATSPAGVAEPGAYYFRRSPFAATPWADDPDRAARLWRASLAATALPDT
jgi:NAD(P)-dependent dehydrogenase (short-subunit alcohol dehydrogenase family)